MLFSTFFLSDWRGKTNIIVICYQSEARNFETAQRVEVFICDKCATKRYQTSGLTSLGFDAT